MNDVNMILLVLLVLAVSPVAAYMIGRMWKYGTLMSARRFRERYPSDNPSNNEE